MKLSVIVVNFNTRDLLAACLEDLRAQVTEEPLEVLVVDNGSADGSLEMLAEDFPEVVAIANPTNLGFAAANNQGLARATGDALMLLNSDTRLPEPALQPLLDRLGAAGRTGLLGCRLLNPDGSPQPSCVADRFPWTYGSPATSGPARWLSGAALVVRREAYLEVGGLDEAFFYTGEDVDWALRMRRAGWQVTYAADVRIVHLGAGTGRHVKLRTLEARHLGRQHFAAKHGGPGRRLWARLQSTGDLVAEGMRALRAGEAERARWCLGLMRRCWRYAPVAGRPT